MSEIEFESAPEGATHFGADADGVRFYRNIDDFGYEYFSFSGQWYRAEGRPVAKKLYPLMLKPDVAPKPVTCTSEKTSKYHRTLSNGTVIDVYDVLTAFGVTNPADAHAIKKMLMPGKRGHKDGIKDRQEAIASIKRAIEIEKENLQFLEPLPESQSPFVVPTLQLKSIE